MKPFKRPSALPSRALAGRRRLTVLAGFGLLAASLALSTQTAAASSPSEPGQNTCLLYTSPSPRD